MYDLSPLIVSLLFATYALLVIPALLVFGPLSDAKGRRELLLWAIVVAALAAALFAAAHRLAVLFVAQAVQAMALGALQGQRDPGLRPSTASPRRRVGRPLPGGRQVVGDLVG